mgnify:CR=1 FL=1
MGVLEQLTIDDNVITGAQTGIYNYDGGANLTDNEISVAEVGGRRARTRPARIGNRCCMARSFMRGLRGRRRATVGLVPLGCRSAPCGLSRQRVVRWPRHHHLDGGPRRGPPGAISDIAEGDPE